MVVVIKKKVSVLLISMRNKFDVEATVDSIQYDPNRTAFIALLVYADGEKRYIVAPNGLQVGQTVISGSNVAPEVGNAMPLSEFR